MTIVITLRDIIAIAIIGLGLLCLGALKIIDWAERRRARRDKEKT